MTFQHKSLAAGRWALMPLDEQMGNIGSEISRAINWKNKGNEEYSRGAVVRALELFDLTLDSQKGLRRLREIARAREVVVDYFWGDNEYGSTETSMRQYFDWFALAARGRILQERGRACG